MTTNAFELQNATIVMLYDVIDHQQISRDAFRRMIAGERPQYMDMSGAPLVINYERLPGTTCIVNDRRIQVQQSGLREPGKGNLAEMATVAKAAIGEQSMISYGLNFTVKGSTQGVGNVGEFLRNKLLRGLPQLEAIFGGQISRMFPRLEYVIADVRYQLSIEPDPIDETAYRAQLNIHHVTDSLPEPSDLSSALDEGLAHLGEALNKTFSLA